MVVSLQIRGRCCCLSVFEGAMGRRTMTMTTARIVAAVMTKMAPLKRNMSVTLRRIEILTRHRSYFTAFCQHITIGNIILAAAVQNLKLRRLTGSGIDSRYKSVMTLGMYTI